VLLASPVARECGLSWDPATTSRGRGSGGSPAAGRSGQFDRPALVVVPRRDRIVPPRSAEALAAALPNVTIMRPALVISADDRGWGAGSGVEPMQNGCGLQLREPD